MFFRNSNEFSFTVFFEMIQINLCYSSINAAMNQLDSFGTVGRNMTGVWSLSEWPSGVSGGHCCSLGACLTPGETILPELAAQWTQPPANVPGEGFKLLFFLDYKLLCF